MKPGAVLLGKETVAIATVLGPIHPLERFERPPSPSAQELAWLELVTVVSVDPHEGFVVSLGRPRNTLPNAIAIEVNEDGVVPIGQVKPIPIEVENQDGSPLFPACSPGQ